MERFIADLVKSFESGKMDRREFCQTVALAATVYAAGDAANAQAPRGMKVLGVNDRRMNADRLRDAVAATAGGEKVVLLLENQEAFRTVTLDYAGGNKYPRLERDEGKPDLLGEILKPRAGKE